MGLEGGVLTLMRLSRNSVSIVDRVDKEEEEA